MMIKRVDHNVKGFYKYCSSCCRQIDFYEYIKYDGKCENCYYC